ncbi:MAG: tRNA (adenosine(37)-N6)-threonylcarbamoyltransferase complex dimerization subunit type 1 TsaB [Clostridia bacterium]
MNKIIIDTANDSLLVVLSIDDQVFSRIGETKSRHNESLLPMIDEIVNEHKLDIKDIDQFGVVVGPGSFTGIRVGIATIKAFRDVLKVDARGINNLDYLFSIASDKDDNVSVVAIKGSRDSYFVARLINGIVYKYERNLSLEELKNIAGDNKVGMFSDDENLNVLLVKPNAEKLLECLDKSGDDKLIPIYYQLSQAENEKLKKGNIVVKDAIPDDLDGIELLENENITNNPISRGEIEKIISDNNYHSFVISFNEKIVGFILLEMTDEINIMSVAVDKEYRNLGLATKLIEKTKEYALSKGIDTLSLEVSERNITAYLLYEKLGFAKRRIRKNYYTDGSNAIEMIFRHCHREDC